MAHAVLASAPREESVTSRQQLDTEDLHQLVLEFRSSAEAGILVGVISPESQLVCQAVMQIDPMLQQVALKMAFTRGRSFNTKDIVRVFKGREFSARVPALASRSSTCFGIELCNEAGREPLCFSFPDTSSRDDFYACLKVVKLTAGSHQLQALTDSHWPTIVVSV